jgi:hypothetical protein
MGIEKYLHQSLIYALLSTSRIQNTIKIIKEEKKGNDICVHHQMTPRETKEKTFLFLK